LRISIFSGGAPGLRSSAQVTYVIAQTQMKKIARGENIFYSTQAKERSALGRTTNALPKYPDHGSPKLRSVNQQCDFPAVQRSV